jgi:hypothetical protein
MSLETWELMSAVVTVVGLPLAIFVFLFEQRKERENEEEEVYQLLSDNYQEFLSFPARTCRSPMCRRNASSSSSRC